jgi:C4-dicarboxylate-specific signal transduction histidine kinase
LTRVIAACGADVEAVARQAQVIQGTLAQEQRASRSSPVVEAVLLTDLIERSIEMIPPALRDCLRIELDDSLAAAEALRLPRLTLQQVCQNLIQNAAESVRQAGRERGTLRVSSAIVAGADGPQLLLRFADDGAGIQPEHLPRLFEKGFSTKSQATNYGIGLHWCANAVNALGGSIRAESGGQGGATFQFMVPLHLAPAVPAAQAA